ncbi:insulin gene enhancer protein ISL-1 isoform X1 [Papio anubis]|uniref:insulin gene enhancer protein ISL-1 isoform X1 n=1 Tax=Papio anubis TaxID=9555 RepID=UPI0004F21253|nr:insulin gene enhancer protein ISL-1 isoform X1 [Papio anubis]
MGDMGDPPKKKRLISLCVGCGNQIHDQYILRVSPDLEWHAACLKCAECNQYLDESCTCFVRDGKTYCKRDYIRLYGIKCAKCSIGFSKNDFVMRARSKVYHIECFRCVACSRQLIPGDEFALREDGLFCRADHDVVERASLGAGDPLSPLHPARPLQMAAEPISARQPALRPHVHKQPEKTTRVRTVLNEKQLHTLRTCYAANPRPDALMKEQLVEMTGLSPRVIRVWFQNKRCKDKKRSIMMKQLQQQQPNDKTVSGSGARQGMRGGSRCGVRGAFLVPSLAGARFSILLLGRSLSGTAPHPHPHPFLGERLPGSEWGSLEALYARGAAARSQPCGWAHALPRRLYLRTGETPSSPPRAGGNEVWPGFCQPSDRQFLTYSRRGRDTNTLGSYLHPGIPWAGCPVSPQGALYF